MKDANASLLNDAKGVFSEPKICQSGFLQRREKNLHWGRKVTIQSSYFSFVS